MLAVKLDLPWFCDEIPDNQTSCMASRQLAKGLHRHRRHNRHARRPSPSPKPNL